MQKPYIIKVVFGEDSEELERQAQWVIDDWGKNGYEPIMMNSVPETPEKYGQIILIFKLTLEYEKTVKE